MDSLSDFWAQNENEHRTHGKKPRRWQKPPRKEMDSYVLFSGNKRVTLRREDMKTDRIAPNFAGMHFC